MMKNTNFVLLFRKPIRNQHSIEKLFSGFEGLSSYVLKNDFKSIFSVFLEFKALRKTYSSFHITGDIHWVHLFLIGRNVSHTYHDFNHFSELTGFKRLVYYLFWIFLPIALAKRIVFISPFTYDTCPVKWLARKKFEIIPNALEFKFSRKRIKLPGRNRMEIIAFNTSRNKNVVSLLSALKILENISFHLNIVGDSLNIPYSENIEVSEYSNLNEEELFNLFSKSQMLWFVSISEGFGLPILEAQAVGIPVITTDSSAMKWVAGESVLYVKNPYDIDEIAKSIQKLIDHKELYRNLIIKGYLNIERFQRNSFTKKYLSVFNSL